MTDWKYQLLTIWEGVDFYCMSIFCLFLIDTSLHFINAKIDCQDKGTDWGIAVWFQQSTIRLVKTMKIETTMSVQSQLGTRPDVTLFGRKTITYKLSTTALQNKVNKRVGFYILETREVLL